ncbi:hypothetical protein OTU49_003496 [Cherax quadricarinatus]|uniref:Uncharacterized protein n=1 Tax=Cherax quadricarinatus TaxID=27406 RepID=A0AAW0X5D1_CHEQU
MVDSRGQCGLTVVAVVMVAAVMVMMAGVADAVSDDIPDPCQNISSLPARKRNICNGNWLLYAAEAGHLHRVHTLLHLPERSYLMAYTDSQGLRKGFTAMMLAAEKNHTEVVEVLVNAGSDVNHTSRAMYTVVYLLAEKGALKTLKHVLDLGAAPDVMTTTGMTPLLIGTWNGYPDVVKMLLEKGANPNVAMPDTLYSPLYMSSKAGDVDMVRALLVAKADVDFQTSWGVTALIVATVWGRVRVVPILLQALANPNIVEKDGFTALHKAVYYRHAEIVKALLNHRALVNVQDSFGRTPLHYCVVRRKGEWKTGSPRASSKTTATKVTMMMELLTSCPDVTITDNSGKTVLDLAEEFQAIELQDVLKGYKSRCG